MLHVIFTTVIFYKYTNYIKNKIIYAGIKAKRIYYSYRWGLCNRKVRNSKKIKNWVNIKGITKHRLGDCRLGDCHLGDHRLGDLSPGCLCHVMYNVSSLADQVSIICFVFLQFRVKATQRYAIYTLFSFYFSSHF